MNDSEKTLEIADHTILLQSQIDALKELILRTPNAPTRERLDSELFRVQSRIQAGQKYRERLDEFRRVIQSQEHAVTLLHSLHDFVLNAVEIPE